jgi:transposase
MRRIYLSFIDQEKREDKMRLKTILNESCDFKQFVIGDSQFSSDRKSIEVKINPRARSKPICSQCGNKGSTYDHLPQKRVEFIPIWGFFVFFIYSMRRVQCKSCGVKVEQVPWSSGKKTITHHYSKYLADWAKEMSWKAVAIRFRTSWQTVFRAVEEVVAYGLKKRVINGVTAIGIDEVQYHVGQCYMTLVYQIDQGCRRLLWVGKDRTMKTLRRFFADMWKEDRSFRKNIKVVCTDMWKAYLTVIKEKIPNAINVLDRFHIMQKFGKALDKIRAQEVKRLKSEGKEPLLKSSRWCFLKRKFNLTKSQKGKLKELVDMNLSIVKAYVLKEQFHKFWEYVSPIWAGKFLDNWCELAEESELEPMIGIIKMLKSHRELILNYFRAKKEFSSGIVEGLNRKVNLTIRKAFGFRSFEVMEVALYHQLGKLPEPSFTHEFW